jgi:hypothetical protein
VLEKYGMAGCGGPAGPDEPLAVFARAHGVSPETVLAELRAANTADAPPAPVPEPDQPESYRHYLRAAVLIGALAGAALGAVNLTWLATWGFTGEMPNWTWWPALIQAHGNAQLYGWTGLFIIGIASHSLPRMLRKPPPAGWLQRAIFGLVASGLLLALFAQPAADRPGWALAFTAGTALQWAGVSLFVGWILRTVRLPEEPHLGFVLAGTLWFWLGATARLGMVAEAVSRGAALPPAEWNAAYLHAMSWGFLLSWVVGYSMRLLPAFMGAPPPNAAASRAALSCLTLGAAAAIVGVLSGAAGLSAAAAALTAVGVGFAIFAVRVWSPALSASDGDEVWLSRFARAAYASLAVAAVILLGLRTAQWLGPVSDLHQHAFGGASRHALTVGFVSLMIVGVAWRILPIFSGAGKPHPALVPTVFGLLVAGNFLRVTGQMAAGLWGGAWYLPMGLSGWLETLAVTLFALDVLRLVSGRPALESLPDAGDPVEVSAEAPVGPLVAHRPWLIPVFARHGMGQVSNPIFQRTVGQRVTVAQGCRRFGVDAEALVMELLEADRRHGRPTCTCCGNDAERPELITLAPTHHSPTHHSPRLEKGDETTRTLDDRGPVPPGARV